MARHATSVGLVLCILALVCATLAAFEPRSLHEQVAKRDEEEATKDTIQEMYPEKLRKMPKRPWDFSRTPSHDEIIDKLGQPPSRVDMRCVWSNNGGINKDQDIRVDFRVFMRPNQDNHGDWCEKFGAALEDGFATPEERLKATGVKVPLRLVRCDQDVNDTLDGPGYVAFASATVEKRPGAKNAWSGHVVVRFQKILINSVNESIIDWKGHSNCAEKGWKNPLYNISPGS